jgi:hypothetical protein
MTKIGNDGIGTISLQDASRLLNLVADLFAASPRKTFTRGEIVHLLRLLPDELAHQLTAQEIQAHVSSSTPS